MVSRLEYISSPAVAVGVTSAAIAVTIAIAAAA